MYKWNKSTRSYELYQPHWRKECAMVVDLNKKIRCAGCGKKIRFGDTYTSKEIHNEAGFGYAVCEDCYRKEDR